MTPTLGGTQLNGKIKQRKGEKIIVEIFNAYKYDHFTTYDLTFETNRIVYQLQHSALEFIEKHEIFNILINHPDYYRQIEDRWPSRSTSVFANSNANQNDLNDEQMQAIDCIVEGNNYPLPYLLYGPPG